MHRYAFIFAFFGCSDQAVPQSQPVKQENPTSKRRIEVPIQPEGPKPVSIASIGARWPAFRSLSTPEQQSVAGALNLVPAPCEACEFRTIAHCATAEPAISCAVLDKLYIRAQKLAQEGASVDIVKVAVNYPDFWISGIGEGVPVQVHLFHDEEGRFRTQTEAVEKGLIEAFGKDIEWTKHPKTEPAPEEWDVRSYPTWFINGHRFRGVQSVNSLARFVSYEVSGRP